MFLRSLDEAESFTCAGIEFGMVLPRDVTNSVEVVRESLKSGQATPVDRHLTFDQLFYILRGAGEVVIGGEPFKVKPQTVVYIPRNTDHSVRSISAEGLEYLYFCVWGQGIPESERGWKQAYSLIHNRRTKEAIR